MRSNLLSRFRNRQVWRSHVYETAHIPAFRSFIQDPKGVRDSVVLLSECFFQDTVLGRLEGYVIPSVCTDCPLAKSRVADAGQAFSPSVAVATNDGGSAIRLRLVLVQGLVQRTSSELATFAFKAEPLGWHALDIPLSDLPEAVRPGCRLRLRLYLNEKNHVIGFDDIHLLPPKKRALTAAEKFLPKPPASRKNKAEWERYRQQLDQLDIKQHSTNAP